MVKYDVIVVGAGPAGSTAAKEMANKGLKVIVLEKHRLDREKPCAGGVTERAIQRFQIPESIFDRSCDKLFLCSPKGKTVTLTYPERIVATTMRAKLDKTLADQASDQGAEFRENTRVIGIITANGSVKGIKAKTSNGSSDIYGDLTVIASGTPSILTKHLGLQTSNKHSQALCYQYQMAMDEKLIDDLVGNQIEVYYGSDIAPGGYAWIFPKKDIVSVGMGTWLEFFKGTDIRLRERLDNFIRNHSVASGKLADAKILYPQAAMISFLGVIKRNYGNGFMVAGEAAGHVDFANGEGIYYSMMSGEHAGKVALSAYNAEDYSADFLRKYKIAIDKEIEKDLKASFNIRRNMLTTNKQQEFTVDTALKNRGFGDHLCKYMRGEVSPSDFKWYALKHPVFLLKMIFARFRS
ncbi:NAD(P)/FAD-dependent oxidoreductase [Candidatus Borrarchaeum sp.]|uniref:NAD(P)/FAD-dependent oxidoreductase n=1 Tax=Candidatus Borrarchaeum sp. TaxID=2846742 RepID=UPI00257FCC95|nr:NAD(P)/FAD-dependent oxidoreductase [Candidatus Borrarchaeum sp.]